MTQPQSLVRMGDRLSQLAALLLNKGASSTQQYNKAETDDGRGYESVWDRVGPARARDSGVGSFVLGDPASEVHACFLHTN